MTHRLFTRLSLLLVAVMLEGCVSEVVATLPKHTPEELTAMTTEQRVAYLSDAHEFSTHVSTSKLGDSPVFRNAIYPTYQVILSQDGVHLAAELYALTFTGQIRQPGNDWERKVAASARSDAAFMRLYSSRSFPTLSIPRNPWLAQLEQDITDGLVKAASRGDVQACEWLSTSTGSLRWKPAVTTACAQVRNGAQASYAAVDNERQQNEAIKAEAERRATAMKPLDVQRAQEVARYCASVGVPNPAVDPQQVQQLIRNWGSRTKGLLGYSPSPERIDQFTNEQAEDIATDRELVSIYYRGLAVTPVLTPRVYMRFVKPQCGL